MTGYALIFLGLVCMLYRKTVLGFYAGLHTLFLGFLMSVVSIYSSTKHSNMTGSVLFVFILLLLIFFVIVFVTSIIRFLVSKNNFTSSQHDDETKIIISGE